MRWLTYFILAYVMLGLQIGLRGFFDIGGAWPNLVLMAAIYIAINAPHDAALLGCFGLGLIQDMTSEQRLGIYALSYGLVAMFTVSTQQIVYRGHPLTHFSLALVGSLLTSFIIAVQGWVRGPSPHVMTLLYCSLYTAVLAPFVLGALHRVNRAFAFQPSRRKMRL